MMQDFFSDRMPFLSLNQQCQSTVKVSTRSWQNEIQQCDFDFDVNIINTRQYVNYQWHCKILIDRGTVMIDNVCSPNFIYCHKLTVDYSCGCENTSLVVTCCIIIIVVVFVVVVVMPRP